jgi:hypothetical protein
LKERHPFRKLNLISIEIEDIENKHSNTYLKMVPLIVTFDVNGHFLSIYCPSIAATGVLNPKNNMIKHPSSHISN